MSGRNPDNDAERVPSYLVADPSRPGGREGVRQPISAAPADPPAEQPPDEVLARAIRTKLDEEGRLDDCVLGARVESGIVTIEGRVGSEYQRELATACAEAVRGVRVVVNSSTIEDGLPLGHTRREL